MNYKHELQKDKNTKCLYLREVRRQRWYCKVTPSEERRSKSLVRDYYNVEYHLSQAMTTVLLMMWIDIRLSKYCTCLHVTDMQKKEIGIISRKFIIWNPDYTFSPTHLCLTSYSPFFGETLKNREGPPLLWGPRIFDLIHFAHGRFCPYLPTMVGQRTLWTGGRFCPLTARGLKIAPQGENSAGRPHPDRWTRGHKYR